MKLSKASALVLIIVLVEGFVSIAVEMLSMRQLLPVVGNTVVVTSLIIGIFLLALAAGYYRGGRNPTVAGKVLLRNFVLAAIWITFGLSYILIALFFQYMFRMGFGAFTVLIVYLLVVVAPLVYWLGQTIPLGISLLDDNDNASRLSGQVLALSTLGSFLGATLTTVLLLNWVGVAWTLWLLIVLLALLVVAITVRLRGFYQYVWVMLGLLLVSFYLNPHIESRLFIQADKYANYAIYPITPKHRHPGFALVINNSETSFLNKEGQVFPYVQFMRHYLFDVLKLRHKQILVLGAGGFTLTAVSDYHNDVTYVDVNGTLKQLVKKHWLHHIHGHFVHADARQYLLSHTKKYDVIVSDIANGPLMVPSFTLTQQYFAQLKSHTKIGGYVLMNMLINGHFSDKYSRRIDNTIRSVFHHCLAVPMYYWNKMDNIEYVCRVLAPDPIIYTDNANEASYDRFTAMKSGT